MDKNEILNLVHTSLEELYRKDEYLIGMVDRNHNSERAIVFRFGIYFNQKVEKQKLGFNVDIEYNRNIDKVKSQLDKRVVPDLILHKRGNNENNILVIEFKTWWNPNQNDDEDKIKKFCDSNGEYKYKYGITIFLAEKIENVRCKLFELNNKEGVEYKWRDLKSLNMKNQY